MDDMDVDDTMVGQIVIAEGKLAVFHYNCQLRPLKLEKSEVPFKKGDFVLGAKGTDPYNFNVLGVISLVYPTAGLNKYRIFWEGKDEPDEHGDIGLRLYTP